MTHYYLYIEEDSPQLSLSTKFYKVAIGHNPRDNRARHELTEISKKRGHYFRLWDDETDEFFTRLNNGFENFLSRVSWCRQMHPAWRGRYAITIPLLFLLTLCKIGIAIYSLLALSISRHIKSSAKPAPSPRAGRKNLSNMDEQLFCKILVLVYATLICGALIIKFIII